MSSINKYLPSEVTIFPNFPSDIQKEIISKCSPGGLINLSGVNKEASVLLTNEVFKKVYNDRHPHLAVLDKLFSKLRSNHPSNCWKVACQVMDPDWKGHQHDKTVSIALRLSPSFLQEALSDVLELKSQKDKYVERIKEICGTHCEDPNSPIDQAWKGYKKYEQECVSVEQEFSQALEQIGEEVDPDEFMSILGDINGDLDESNFEGAVGRFINMSYEEFVGKTDERRKEMSEEHFLLYQQYAKLNQFEQRLAPICERREEFRIKYEALDEERVQRKLQIENIDSLINDFNSNAAVIHMGHLTSEWNQAREITENIESQPHLKKCVTLMYNLWKLQIEPTPGECAEIRSLINACADRHRIEIWKHLYDLFAKQVIEDSWAENHFQEHMTTLTTIVGMQSSDIGTRLERAGRYYKSHPTLPK